MKEIHRRLVRDTISFYGCEAWEIHHENSVRVYGFNWDPAGSRPVAYLNGYCVNPSCLPAIAAFFARPQIKIIHWLGTDVMFVRQGIIPPPPAVDIHLCDSWNLKLELESLGIDATVVCQTPRHRLEEPLPMPEEKRLAIYMPPGRHDFFRFEVADEVRRRIAPEWEVDWIDANWDDLRNQRIDMKALMARCRTYLRIPVHDGFSHTSAEFLMAGRTVLTTQERPCQIRVKPEVDDIIAHLEEPPFEIGPAYYRWLTHPDRLFEILYARINDSVP